MNIFLKVNFISILYAIVIFIPSMASQSMLFNRELLQQKV